ACPCFRSPAVQVLPHQLACQGQLAILHGVEDRQVLATPFPYAAALAVSRELQQPSQAILLADDLHEVGIAAALGQCLMERGVGFEQEDRAKIVDLGMSEDVVVAVPDTAEERSICPKTGKQ